ncbi:MAG: hypothetical protein HY909_19420 [Deltaproteobacteria bacterium]|nr:hypothetical protein [Deltaproteobacteria bacterium]
MDKATRVLTAALLRPLNLVAPAAGLALTLVDAPWWTFPLSLVPYGAMVYLSALDQKFVRKVLDTAEVTGGVDWDKALAGIKDEHLRALLGRLKKSEEALAREVSAAPSGLSSVLAQCLQQLRSAAALGVELARRVENLDTSLHAMDPAGSRAEAGKRRSWAQSARDEGAKSEFLEAAARLDEAAGSAEALLRLRERTLAQLDNVAASLESAAVRAVRVRVDGGEGAGEGALQEALRVDVETLRDTLGVFESAEVEAPRRAARGESR